MTDSNGLATFSLRQRGATMLEFALVLGVLLILVLGLIDIGRYFTARALLSRAATYALARSQIDPDLQIDLRTAVLGSAPYNRFVAARQKIINNAVGLATMAIVAPSSAPFADTHLLEIQIWDPISALPRPTYLSDLLILLPGQHAIVTSTGDRIYHQTLCALGDGCPGPAPALPVDIPVGLPFGDILLRHPVTVEIRGVFRPLLPVLPTQLQLRVRVYGEFQKVSSALYPPTRTIPPSIP